LKTESSCILCENAIKLINWGEKEKDGQKRTAVNPDRCIVFCRGCEEVCPAGDISHPSEEITQKTIDKLKKEKAQ
jgi:formate hydrogenlyase subunit 6/NADH:ubiquinone oxidoreductase subunit I